MKHPWSLGTRQFEWIAWNLDNIDAHALSAEEVEAAFVRVFHLEERRDGLDAMPNLDEIVENLPQKAWKRLQRRVGRTARVLRRCSREQPAKNGMGPRLFKA